MNVTDNLVEVKIAEEEDFGDAARTFRMVAKVEAYHERRYRKLLANVDQRVVLSN